MTFKRRTKKLVSELLAVVTVITTAFAPMVTYAAEGEVKDTAIPYYKEVKDQLDADEVVVAKDIEITVGSDFNVKTDFSGIEISDESKVKVKFVDAQNEEGHSFTTDHADSYSDIE